MWTDLLYLLFDPELKGWVREEDYVQLTLEISVNPSRLLRRIVGAAPDKSKVIRWMVEDYRRKFDDLCTHEVADPELACLILKKLVFIDILSLEVSSRSADVVVQEKDIASPMRCFVLHNWLKLLHADGSLYRLVLLFDLVIQQQQGGSLSLYHVCSPEDRLEMAVLDEEFKAWLLQAGEPKYRYQLREVICHTKYGELYKCAMKEQNFIAKRVCFQRLDNDLALCEASYLHNLRHEGVVCCSDFWYTSDSLYMVLERLEGPTLHDHIQQTGPLSELNASIMMRRVLKAVSYLHERMIIHRDLSSNNIMFGKPGDFAAAKLIDLGFSIRSIGHHDSVVRCGTVNFIAPEIYTQSTYDFKIDVFSLGVVLYQALSGLLPFYSPVDEIIMRKTITGDFQTHDMKWLEISEEAKHLVHGMLAVDPKERFSLDQCLVHPFVISHL